MNNKEDIIKKLSIFGLSEEASNVYLPLLNIGPMGVVAISKAANMGRNVAYRLLAELEDKQLITIAEKSFGKEYSALAPQVFEGIIAEKEAEIGRMKNTLPSLTAVLDTIAGDNKQSKIIHYEGVNGLKQVNWNLTKAKKEFRVFELEHLSDYLDKSFAEKLRNIWQKNKITSFDITNKKSVDVFTANLEFWRKYSKYTYIDPKILEIKFEMYIYNNVVTLLNYQAEVPHSIEIYDQSLADMQKQLFDIIWAQGRPMRLEKGTNRKYVADN